MHTHIQDSSSVRISNHKSIYSVTVWQHLLSYFRTLMTCAEFSSKFALQEITIYIPQFVKAYRHITSSCIFYWKPLSGVVNADVTERRQLKEGINWIQCLLRSLYWVCPCVVQFYFCLLWKIYFLCYKRYCHLCCKGLRTFIINSATMVFYAWIKLLKVLEWVNNINRNIYFR